MGTTYSNCQIRSNSQDAVADALKPLLKEPAYVSPPVGGWVGVYPEGDADAADKLAKKLSAKLACGVFFWSVYDSDIFFYTLYENGKKCDEFDSNPDCFETVSTAKKARLRGKPEALMPYCLPGIGYSQVQNVLHPPLLSEEEAVEASGESLISDKSLQIFANLLHKTLEEMKAGIAENRLEKYTFAEEQAEDLAKLLGIAEDLEACEYRDVAEANGDFANRHFQLVGNENLSQAYLDQKLWDSEVIHHPEKTQEWLQKGANPNARNQSGRTILFRWAESCVPEQIAILLKAGADVNAGTDGQGRWERGVTALMVAAGRSYEQADRVTGTVKLLLEAGADVNARSETGRTALSEALVMTDGAEHQGKIGRHALEDVLRQAAERSAQVVEMLRTAGATE